jgi:hypothetical protein
LHAVTTKALAAKRTGPDVLNAVEEFLRVYKGLLERGCYTAQNTIFYDETSAHPFCDKSTAKRLVATGRHKANLIRGKSDRPITVLPFATAAGEKVMVAYILELSEYRGDTLARDLIIEPDIHPPRNSFHAIYVFTRSGKLSGEAFRAIAAALADRWELMHPGLCTLLIGDSAPAHHNLEAVQLLAERNIQMLFLVCNTTHWSQPWDDVPFATFKRKLRLALDDAFSLCAGEIPSLKSMIMMLASDLLDAAFTQPIIERSARDVGLYPFNPDLIRKLAAENNFSSKFASPQLGSHERAFYLAVQKLATPVAPTAITAPVRPGQVYTGEQLMARAAARKKRKAEAEVELKEKQSAKRAKLQDRLADALALGEDRLEARRKGCGVKRGEQWNEPQWVANQTCRVCRRTQRVGHWKGANCKALWFCPDCRVMGADMLAKHEDKCRDCKKKAPIS